LIVKGPEPHEEWTLELDSSTGLLLGRAPDTAAVQRLPEDGERALQPQQLSSPSISANHALAWSEAGRICVRDLGSRNGTWLLLPRGQTVGAESESLVVQLANNHAVTTVHDEPVAPRWRGRSDFGPALSASIDFWLRAQGLEARVRVAARGSDTESSGRIPLASGDTLEIAPLRTVNTDWARVLERIWRWVSRQNLLFESESEAHEEGLILASAKIRSAHAEVVEAARGGARTMLITGPSGAGKEKLAETFHRHSGRNGPFVAVNCSMFNKELLRSELFGADVGSFTGATRRIVGAVERAQGGTLFLDEIGELSTEVQPMLLRFLERQEYERVGVYGRAQRADVRIVAATNRDLREATRSGAFRADLWYRLSVHVIEVPPLNARWDDVVAYLQSIPAERQSCSLFETLTPEAVALLRAHGWEGNFRELSNFAQRLPRNAKPSTIDAATCRRALERGSLRPVSASSPPPTTEGRPVEWSALVARATQAFVEDHGKPPTSWDEQKEWNEKYFKPLLFFHLSGIPPLAAPPDETMLSTLVSRAASSLQADRGTAFKQLSRYFDRFKD
jgi:DNA-binding NtrC family response regulator